MEQKQAEPLAVRRYRASIAKAVRLGAAAAAVLVLNGCPQFASGPGLPIGAVVQEVQDLECLVTVRNPDANGVELTLSSRLDPFLSPDGVVLRPYRFEGGCPFESPEEVVADWRRFANQRIQEVAADPDSSSVLRVFPEAWCEVSGTLRCRDTGDPTFACPPVEPLTAEPLPTCPDPPPNDRCLEITCNGQTPCTQIGFNDVAVGASTREKVELRNCSAANGPDVDVIGLDGAIAPIGQQGDFAIAIDSNTCYPPDPDDPIVTLAPDETCAFDVDFQPRDPGSHSGETTFTSSDAASPHTVTLTGTAVGGALSFRLLDDPTLPIDLPIPLLCVDARVQASCTAPRTIEVQNAGPGTVRIDAIGFIDAAELENFVLEGLVEGLELPADQSRTFTLKWCGPNSATDEGDLVIDTNVDNPNSRSFVQRVRRQEGLCPSGT